MVANIALFLVQIYVSLFLYCVLHGYNWYTSKYWINFVKFYVLFLYCAVYGYNSYTSKYWINFVKTYVLLFCIMLWFIAIISICSNIGAWSNILF